MINTANLTRLLSNRTSYPSHYTRFKSSPFFVQFGYTIRQQQYVRNQKRKLVFLKFHQSTDMNKYLRRYQTFYTRPHHYTGTMRQNIPHPETKVLTHSVGRLTASPMASLNVFAHYLCRYSILLTPSNKKNTRNGFIHEGLEQLGCI